MSLTLAPCIPVDAVCVVKHISHGPGGPRVAWLQRQRIDAPDSGRRQLFVWLRTSEAFVLPNGRHGACLRGGRWRLDYPFSDSPWPQRQQEREAGHGYPRRY